MRKSLFWLGTVVVLAAVAYFAQPYFQKTLQLESFVQKKHILALNFNRELSVEEQGHLQLDLFPPVAFKGPYHVSLDSYQYIYEAPAPLDWGMHFKGVVYLQGKETLSKPFVHKFEFDTEPLALEEVLSCASSEERISLRLRWNAPVEPSVLNKHLLILDEKGKECKYLFVRNKASSDLEILIASQA